jgi:archaellin
MLASRFNVELIRRLWSRLAATAGRPHAAESGLATVTLALVAFLATATTAATITIAEGDVNFEALGNLVDDSVNRVGATLEVRGSVIARANVSSNAVSQVQVTLRYYGEGMPVPLTADDPDRMVIAYHDDALYNPDVPYAATFVSDDGDGVLEPGEVVLISIDAAGLDFGGEQPALTPGARFTLELSAPVGGTVIVSRRLPAIFQPVMSLY